jgi:hypothetical protein
MELNRFLLFVNLFFFQFTYSQQVNWIGFEEAFELQKKFQNPLLLISILFGVDHASF